MFNPTPDQHTTPHIFLTGPNGSGLKDLGTFNGTYDLSISGLNNSGQLIVQSFDCFACDKHNFITGVNGVGSTEIISPLGDMSITSMNDAGKATGLFGDGSAFARQPFITGGNNTNGLTIIGGFDNRSDDNRAYDINNNNQIVGSTSGFDHEDGRFLFQNAYVSGPDGEGITNLGTLGGYSSWANAINDSGEVIGISSTASGESAYQSFLYSHEGITNLSLLDVVIADGWTNISVIDINNHGQIIGVGDHGDLRHTAFLLSYTPDTIFDPQPIFIPGPPPPPPIPEPTTWLMLLAGLGLIGFMRVKKNT